MARSSGLFSVACRLTFLVGQMVSIRSATFLVEPGITICCVPTVLCFEEERDAQRFGGTAMTWEDAQADVRDHMTLMKKGMTE